MIMNWARSELQVDSLLSTELTVRAHSHTPLTILPPYYYGEISMSTTDIEKRADALARSETHETNRSEIPNGSSSKQPKDILSLASGVGYSVAGNLGVGAFAELELARAHNVSWKLLLKLNYSMLNNF